MSDRPFFSVIVPTYNRAERIRRSLQSVFDQTFCDFEVIVVDDCSTDSTQDVLAPMVDRGEIRLLRHGVNSERGQARNTGMESARGRYVTFLDSDDLMYPSNLADAHAYALAHPETKCFHNLLERVTEDGRVEHTFRYPRLGNPRRAIATGNFLSGIGVFLHEDVYRSYRFSADRMLSGSEDWEFWLRVLARYDVGRIPKVNNGVIDHPGRGTRREDLDVVRTRKTRIVAGVRADPELRSAYGPHLRAMEAGVDVFMASAANSAGRHGAAARFLFHAACAYLPCLFWGRFVRAARCAVLGVGGSPVESRAVLAIAVYPDQVASTRLRVTQYAPHLACADWELRTWSFLSNKDLAGWFDGGALRRAGLVLRGVGRLRTLPRLLRGARLVIVQREALPFGPPWVEALLSTRVPLVWDVDDAIWECYPSLFSPRLPDFLRKSGAKYDRLARMAAEVWAGSEVLGSWCRQKGARVRVVPTVAALTDPEAGADRIQTRVVGWIGSPSTAPFLQDILDAVAEIRPPVQLLVVGGRVVPPPGLETVVRAWSPEAEEEALQSISVGLYPVDIGHPLAKGKCGFKAILYMSRGIPSVVTPTTTNAQIVRDGVDGLHARTATEWRSHVESLLADAGLWSRLSAAGRGRVADAYSLAGWAPAVVQRVEELVGERTTVAATPTRRNGPRRQVVGSPQAGAEAVEEGLSFPRG